MPGDRIRSLASNAAKLTGVFGVLALTSTVAFGLPWDIDMADGQQVKAYEQWMSPPVEGTVPQTHELSPGTYREPMTWADLQTANTLTNPVPDTPENRAVGERLYRAQCWACHNNGQELGNVSKHYPGIAILSGDAPAARLKAINDGRLYLTIRVGSASTLMPGYGNRMSDPEIWALIRYLRTMPESTYTPPAPKPEEAPQ